jgi:hypothetical protein
MKVSNDLHDLVAFYRQGMVEQNLLGRRLLSGYRTRLLDRPFCSPVIIPTRYETTVKVSIPLYIKNTVS